MIEIENYIIFVNNIDYIYNDTNYLVICSISSENIYLPFSSNKKKNDAYLKIKNILKRYKTSYNF